MNRHLPCLLLLALLATVSLGATTTDDGPTRLVPRLREGRRLSVDFTITNPYDRAVRVKRLFSTCVCFKLTVDQRFLLPHAEATISVAIDNSNTSGLQTQRIYVEFTDRRLEMITRTLQWMVVPDVAVDSIPPSGPFDRRPEKAIRRNVYLFTSHERPDELHRLEEIIMVTSPPLTRPAGGLKVTGLEYDGSLWNWQQRQIDPGTVLIVGRAANPDAEREPAVLKEKLIVHTNHPRKAKIELRIYTALDYEATDPWAELR